MSSGYRQEVFNVLLAQLLQDRGIIAVPEEILAATIDRGRRMPDVIATFRGLRTAIEGEVGDRVGAEDRALESARSRVEEGVSLIGLAIIYPAPLRTVAFSRLKSSLEASSLRIAVVTEAGETGFMEGNVDTLSGALRRAFDQLIREDVLGYAVAEIEKGIEVFRGTVSGRPGAVGRIAEVLGIRELPSDDG